MENHLDGLPKYGVTLSGSPKNPVIENRPGRTVLAYVFKTADQNGHGSIYQQLLATSVQPAGGFCLTVFVTSSRTLPPSSIGHRLLCCEFQLVNSEASVGK